MAIIKTGALAATGEGETVVINKGWINLRGTWTGTVNVQTDVTNSGVWANATDETGEAIALTTAASCPIDNAVAMKTRLYFTRSSGTLDYTIRGEP